MRWVLAGALVGMAALFTGLALLLSHPGRPHKRAYAAETPDALMASVFEAVDRGETDRLADFIYSPTPEFRGVLDRLGRLLGDVGDLGKSLNERFPGEVKALKDEAAKGGGSGLGSLVGAAMGGAGRGPGARSAGQGGQQQMLQTLLADPYGWAKGLKDRVTTVVVGEDIAAVQVDGAPALSGLGLSLRRAEGRWYIDLPLQLPMVREYVPQTPEERQVLASMIQVVDNAVVDLTKDVRGGKCATLKDAAGLAGEKAFGPMMICVVAYNRAMEARKSGGASPAVVAPPAQATSPAPAPHK